MNEPRAIEIAFATCFRQFAEIGSGVVIRPWQSLRWDGTWDEDKDRAFPCVDIRCGQPSPDEFDETRVCDCEISCMTKADDDLDHAAVSALFGGVKETMDKLYAQQKSGTPSDELTTFAAILSSELGANFAGVGGLTWGASVAPYDDGGVNVIGLTMRVHYARKDY